MTTDAASLEFLRPDWPAPASVFAGTTLRPGGCSVGSYRSLNLGAHVDDSREAVQTNRRRLVSALSLPEEPAWLRQVHGSRVVEAPFEGSEPEADAVYTTRIDVICAVLTADCLPILFCSRDGQEVAAAHAGWRGLAAGVLASTVASLKSDPGALYAWLGPAISQSAFEVGDEVRELFIQRRADYDVHFQPNARGRWQADLYALARRELEHAGVGAVFGGERCTYAESRAFFSHRRDGQCGRMASLIYRTSAVG